MKASGQEAECERGQGRRAQIRMPNPEYRKNSESRNPNWPSCPAALNGLSKFTSSLRLSVFGFCASILSLVLSFTLGCSSTKNDARVREAYLQGQNEALREQQPKTPMIRIRGFVRKPAVPFAEGMRLADALVAADYYGFGNPRNIIITREGQPFEVNPRRLLNGQDNPVLQAEDQIELVP